MQLMVNSQVIYSAEIVGINEFDKIWIEMTKTLFEQDKVIEYIEVNGQPIFENYNEYILLNFDNITELNIRTITEKQFLTSMVQELQEMIDQLLNINDHVAEIFYGDISSDDWSQFSQYIQQLDGLYQILRTTDSLTQKLRIGSNISTILLTFEQTIQVLEKAVDQKRYIDVADIIEYEFMVIFKDVRNTLNELGGTDE